MNLWQVSSKHRLNLVECLYSKYLLNLPSHLLLLKALDLVRLPKINPFSIDFRLLRQRSRLEVSKLEGVNCSSKAMFV